MKRVLIIGVLWVVLLAGCGGGEAPENTAPLCQFDYLFADLTAYGEAEATYLTPVTITLTADYREADEETLYAACEEVMCRHLVGRVTIRALIEEDVAYQRAALTKYYDAMRVYENAIREMYGDPADVIPDLTAYLIEVFAVSSAAEAEAALTHAAEELARENLAVALAYRALGLTVTEETRAEVAAYTAEEHGGEVTDEAYIHNRAMYVTVMEYLLDGVRCKVQFEQNH